MYRFRSLTTSILMAALVALVGCSKENKVEEEEGLTQTEADDLTQQLAAQLATDGGGWLLEVTSSVDGTPLTTSAVGRVMRDTAVTRANMNWSFTYTYHGPGGATSGTWNSTATRVDAVTEGLGTVTLAPFAGASGAGSYHHHTESFTMDGLLATDSLYNITNLAVVDSALFTITTSSANRFYLLDNVITYDIDLPKRLAATPHAGHGEARINCFGSVLASANPTSRTKLLDAVLVVTFDGSDTPLATITADTSTPTAVYRYRINLKTGAVTRA